MTKPEHISALKRDPRNARQHTPRTLSTIERSLNRDGFGRSILLAKDGTIIAGNATTDAAINAGLENVRIIDSDGTEVIAVRRTDIEPGSAEFTHLAIADNRAAEHSSFSPEVLQALIDDGLVEPDEFWFPEELTEVLAGDGDDEPAGGLTDPDEVPDVPDEPITKRGDLWQLGRHRLLCGDSTVVTDVDRLMDGQKAGMVFTDPPYGMDYHGTTFGTDGLSNDTEATFEQTLADSMALVPGYAPDAVVAVCFGASRLDKFFASLQHLRFHRLLTIYKPNRMAKPWHGWIMTSEVIALFSTGKPTWIAENHCHDVYTFDYSERPDRSVDHPTVKPLSIVADVIGKGCPPRGTVLDIFAGSGTTLVACEQTGRTARLMELEPKFCDVIVKRWEDYTGETATLITSETDMSSGKPHELP